MLANTDHPTGTIFLSSTRLLNPQTETLLVLIAKPETPLNKKAKPHTKTFSWHIADSRCLESIHSSQKNLGLKRRDVRDNRNISLLFFVILEFISVISFIIQIQKPLKVTFVSKPEFL